MVFPAIRWSDRSAAADNGQEMVKLSEVFT
jgi:hypothetical protein